MSLINLCIQGETPAKKNSRVTLPNGRNIPSKRYREWHSGAEGQVVRQWALFLQAGLKEIDTPVKLTIFFFHKDDRRRDSDNAAASILDLLQDCGVLKDDCWQIVRELSIKNFKDNSAHCDILIRDYEEEEEDQEDDC